MYLMPALVLFLIFIADLLIHRDGNVSLLIASMKRADYSSNTSIDRDRIKWVIEMLDIVREF